MRVLPALGPVICLQLSAAWIASLVLAGLASAQIIQFGESTALVELTPPRADVISGNTAARLEQARILAAEQHWDEAVDLYRELAAEDDDRVVALDERRFVALRTYCHMKIARLPAEGLAAYRRRTDPVAEQWYIQGVASRDERLLRRVVDDAYCSTWGDDAMSALGEMALEQGDYDAVRRWWEQLSPQLRDGRHDWLSYPDTQLDLANVRARLVLVSIRAGERERASSELAAFRQLHPNAVGRLGGKDAPYAVTLENLLESSADWPAGPRESNWPTFAGSTSRCQVAEPLPPSLMPAWKEPVALSRVELIHPELTVSFDPPVEAVKVSERQLPLSCFPILCDGKVLFADASGIRAADLLTGQPAVTPNGLLYRDEAFAESSRDMRSNRSFTFSIAALDGTLHHSLTAAEGIVYGRLGEVTTGQLDPRQRPARAALVGLDLQREGLLAFRTEPQDDAWSFDGVPVSDGRHVFVAMRRIGATPHAFVTCFDATTGDEQWRTSIGAADTPAAGRGEEVTHNLLTLVGDRIYFNTNLGLVAALDSSDGRICWIHRYERHRGPIPKGDGRPPHFDRDPSPCMYHGGLVIVAPSDTAAVFALDAETGQLAWTSDKLAEASHLVGAVNQNLVISGNRLWILEFHSGQVRHVWPAKDDSEITGCGCGLVAGEEIFWPTIKEIHVLHVLTCQPTRPPFSLTLLGNHGANLAAAKGFLLAAGPDKLMAFGPPAANLNSQATPQPFTSGSQPLP